MLKVLIVEDEDIIRNGLVHTINWLEMGCSVVGAARDGIQGLEMIMKYSPDFVITDIKMPRLGGIEMLNLAQKERSFKSIILTCYSEFEYVKKAIEMQVFDYLLKPIDEEKLGEIITKIQNEIDQKRRYSHIMEIAKNVTIIELERWSIYSNMEVTPNLYVKQALDKICQFYQQKLNIEQVAEELGISISYLSRKIKEFTGQTFLDILNKYRIQKSVQLLNSGKYRIYEISRLTGFSEYKYFYRVFKKYTGMSPTEFIKSADHAVCKRISTE